jgi:hypothetical protein
VALLGQTQALFRKLVPFRHISSPGVEREKPGHDSKGLGGLSELLTQVPRPCVGIRDFRRGQPFSGHQRRSAHELQRQFVLPTFRRIRPGREQPDGFGEMLHRFSGGRPTDGGFPCVLKILHRFGRVPSALEVQGQFSDNVVDVWRLCCFESLPDALVQLRPDTW